MPEFQETNRIKPMTPLSAKRIEFNQTLEPTPGLPASFALKFGVIFHRGSVVAQLCR